MYNIHKLYISIEFILNYGDSNNFKKDSNVQIMNTISIYTYRKDDRNGVIASHTSTEWC